MPDCVSGVRVEAYTGGMPTRRASAWLEDFVTDPDPWPYIIDAYQATYADDDARLVRAIGRLWNDVVQAEYGGRQWSALSRAPIGILAADAVQPEELALFMLLLVQIVLEGERAVTVPRPPKANGKRGRQ